MVAKKKAARFIASVRPKIAAVDDQLINEVVGVAQALDELRKALAKVEAHLDRRDYEEAADLGYESVSSGFVFLQRTLGGLHSAYFDKVRIVQDLAGEIECAYEDILPHVDAVMHSAQPRKRRGPASRRPGRRR